MSKMITLERYRITEISSFKTAYVIVDIVDGIGPKELAQVNTEEDAKAIKCALDNELLVLRGQPKREGKE